MTELAALSAWYAAHCDGVWEHDHGVVIETLDNPGWRLLVDLRGTALEARHFDDVSAGDPSTNDWKVLRVRNARFEGMGDPSRLGEIIRGFVDWATASE